VCVMSVSLGFGPDRLRALGRRRPFIVGRDRRGSPLPFKHILRAPIVLLLAERIYAQDVARRAGVSRPAVWRWQHRYGEDGVAGLLRDKTRPPGIPPYLPTRTVAEVLALTCSEPPDAVTHWTRRAVAAWIGISTRSVQRI
jgi:transposase